MSLIRGEYWIDDGGSSTYADNDVGDVGHELAAWESAIQLDSDSVPDGVEVSPNDIDFEGLANAYLEDEDKNPDGLTIESITEMPEKERVAALVLLGVDAKRIGGDVDVDLALQWLSDHGANMEFIDWWFNSKGKDARDYAMEKMGWIRVQGDNFQVWELDDETLKRIQNFDEWENVEAGDAEDGDIEKSEEEIGIEERKTGWFENVALRDLFRFKSAQALKSYKQGVGKWR